VPAYDYECPSCGRFEVVRPISEVADRACCPQCGATSRRLYTAPNVSRTPRNIAAARERSERSAESPQVVGKDYFGKERHTPHRPHVGRPWQIGH